MLKHKLPVIALTVVIVILIYLVFGNKPLPKQMEIEQIQRVEVL